MNVINRAKSMILSPKTEWDVIDGEQPDNAKVITGYVLPLAGLAAIAAFIGYAFIGFDAGLFRIKGINWGIYQAINTLVGAVLGVFVSAFVIDALASSFGSEKNMGRSVQLVAYAYTPAWVGGLLAVLPRLAFLGAIFALYGLYLLYIGLPKMKRTPEDKQLSYFIVSLLVILAVYFVIGMIMSALVMPSMGLSMSKDILESIKIQ
ncbi:Yip1 family protein [Niabella drilacis]|uniref:Yip1 domain-containing protein n=1 Tax=Niabella drilacis (strain DSM 25811 / CCM 8410 / CCUG 62505 / LMG 26954 / E90) TaxID=1285928 RepID=A0A1G6QEH7_NIADE|nr:Yip1 family protein [Niabella drilacis]SDC90334.1 Yip1 domain-containing protein [Niabella drilacis]